MRYYRYSHFPPVVDSHSYHKIAIMFKISYGHPRKLLNTIYIHSLGAITIEDA